MTLPTSLDKKSILITMPYASWGRSSWGNLFSEEPKYPRSEIVEPRRASKVGVADDASALVVTFGKASAHKPTIQQCNEHAVSPVELRKEGGDSSSVGADASLQKKQEFLTWEKED